MNSSDRVKVQLKFAGATLLVLKICSFVVVSWETDALGILKHPWRERICFKEIVITGLDVFPSFLQLVLRFKEFCYVLILHL